jgi:hypothetical protein
VSHGARRRREGLGTRHGVVGVRARRAAVVSPRARRRAVALGSLALLALAAALLARGGGSRAAALEGAGEPVAQTDASVPASRVTLIGASPLEAPGETWGVGQANDGSGASRWVVVRYDGSSWSLGPPPLDASGQPLSGFVPDAPSAGGTSASMALAGQMTPSGAGVLVGTLPAPPPAGGGPAGSPRQVVLVRDPGGAFRETAPVPQGTESEPTAGLLAPGEALFGAKRAPLIAPLDEAGGHAGALVVPTAEQGAGVENGVLHWDGSAWTREPIAIPAASAASFRVLGIGASSPANAWLLGELAGGSHYPAGAVALFRRDLSTHGGPSWQPVKPAPGAEPGDPLTVPVTGTSVGDEPFTVPGTGDPPTVLVQVLTVTSEGVWVDGVRSDTSASTTLFFEPEGEAAAGRVVASWCELPGGVAPGTAACDHELPEALPTGPSRSIAWADPSNPAGFGERVITGFTDGVSLRLDGSSFTRVLALGASQAPNDVGGTYGAAFSEPREGWLGNLQLPVHLTLHPVASRLTPYPVPFRHALVAIAPQPGAPVGALSSEALAVGDQGQVARYTPGKGWLPESLLSVGGRHATPRLRAVAWPTPTRAYAVGDRGQMWRWEAETDLWEPDPATPFNFRGNLTGIAFDPNDPAVGYAIGEEGLLLGYGKTWTQEALPEGLAKATFTSIAFAGSEVLIAYHELPDPSTNRYLGGILRGVPGPNGEPPKWEIDAGAGVAMGGNVPWAVAGLPDGGAAFTVGEPSGEGTGGLVFERSAQGAPWQPTPTPLPGGLEPGSLALFREGGELRAIASGSVPNTYPLESLPPPPPGFPPNLIAPYPLSAGYGAGHVVRQTASGWSDEEHELNNAHEPPGHYASYDMVYQPDPVSAVLVDPSGKEGWAVGGFVDAIDADGALDTALAARYPADGVAPPGLQAASIPSNPAMVTLAVGGGAQCAAPCADRAKAGVGPNAWLSSALTRAGQIAGVSAFIYTGPHITDGATAGPATLAIPYERELASYAGLLAASPIPAFAAASPTDLAEGGEGAFKQAFGDLPFEPEASEPEQSYYAFDASGAGGKVRVVVLDDTSEVGGAQLEWLERELGQAAGEAKPAIVVGNADLGTQIRDNDAAAAGVAKALIEGNASAYFYDAPEQNVKLELGLPGLRKPPIKTFGSGTLGYVNHLAEDSGAFLGASGFLKVEVNAAASAREASGRFPVEVELVPDIEQLALEAKDGTLLRRSQAALFEGLARRPRAGNRSQNQLVQPDTDPYIPIPENCVGAACAEALLPSYTFSSTREDIGEFVEPNLASPDPHAVVLGANEKPVNDPKSGLFCAYNAGSTIVTISAGGLSASLPVTVQAGSPERPCGTKPLKPQPGEKTASFSSSAPPPLQPAPTPAGSPPPTAAAPLPLTVPPLPPPLPAAALPAFIPPLTPLFAPRVFVPPPLPTVARPAPPSGTSSVNATSSVFQTEPIAEEQREEEEAIESASAQSAAHDATEHEPLPLYVLGVAILAAFAGATAARGRPRRGRRELRVAAATLTAMRAQQRMARETRRAR